MAFSYFFRDRATLEKTVDLVLERCKPGERIRVWDAGCAYGQEPFSLIMLFVIREGQGILKNLEVIASDIDYSKRFGAFIHNGIYLSRDLERMPEELWRRFFTKITDREVQLMPAIRSCVRYVRHDLRDLVPVTDRCDLIVSKNVLMHLEPPERNDVMMMFHHSLKEDGLLALGQNQDIPDRIGEFFRPLDGSPFLFQKPTINDTPPARPI